MTDNSDEHLRYWLALIRAPYVGSATFQHLLTNFKTVEDVFSASPELLLKSKLRQDSIDYIRKPDWSQVDKDLIWLEQSEVNVLLLSDPDYPALLREISDPPPVLFVLGDQKILQAPQLAIVGSRNPTPSGKETAYDFARHLAQQGLTITSGMALGIDAASHEGALEAGGSTIAVAGTGLDSVYPGVHHELAHKIANNGALVSEFPPGTSPSKHNFPRRNRIISALSMGVLVVEAALRSGSLITARQALEQGREVFAVPGSIHNPQARGCNSLIKQGAKLVETADDILEELGSLFEFTQHSMASGSIYQTTGESDNEVALEPEYQKVFESVGFEPTAVDTVIERSGLTADAVCSMLLVLELQGLIGTTSSGHYCQVR
jgi:DNA processing protein